MANEDNHVAEKVGAGVGAAVAIAGAGAAVTATGYRCWSSCRNIRISSYKQVMPAFLF